MMAVKGWDGVIEIMDKHAIIKLKQQGVSNRKAAKLLNINRKTVAIYWNEYQKNNTLLNALDVNEKEVQKVQEKICEAPKYNAQNRKPRKYTAEIDTRLDEILESESEKCKELGRHKQQLTNLQIHQMLVNEKFDIGYTTITNKIREKRNKAKECFIKQSYDLGQRLEYDFGEVKLEINGEINTYHLAVLSSPAADFRWAYLYKNQKQDVFMDSHVRFFDMLGGVYSEIVYDNMRNVVSKFIGKTEKILNENLLKLSLYYGFDINVTNCFSGNEKGHVEGSVKIIRNKAFALTYKFKTFDDAREYLNTILIEINKDSTISEEIKQLQPTKPKLDLATVTVQKPNKYSFVRVDNNHYSVPEYLVGRLITIKKYYETIGFYSNNILVCEHKKIDGTNEISIEIKHYLNSLNKKPGAIKNSHALKSIPRLKAIYDTNFSRNKKKFIEIIQENDDKPIEEILLILETYNKSHIDIIPSIQIDKTELNNIATRQVSRYNELCFSEVE